MSDVRSVTRSRYRLPELNNAILKIVTLRLLTWYFILEGFAMSGATFNLVARIEIPYYFGTLKDSSLKINNLPLNNCFSYRNLSPACGSNNKLREFRLPVSAFATVAEASLLQKLFF